jgi:hypothetical protein
MLDNIITDVAIRNNYNLHSTLSEKLQNYTDLEEELIKL